MQFCSVQTARSWSNWVRQFWVNKNKVLFRFKIKTIFFQISKQIFALEGNQERNQKVYLFKQKNSKFENLLQYFNLPEIVAVSKWAPDHIQENVKDIVQDHLWLGQKHIEMRERENRSTTWKKSIIEIVSAESFEKLWLRNLFDLHNYLSYDMIFP